MYDDHVPTIPKQEVSQKNLVGNTKECAWCRSPNILLDDNCAGKICDVGIAKYTVRDFTSLGQAFGSWDWASPEQILCQECSSRTDIYSLGVVSIRPEQHPVMKDPLCVFGNMRSFCFLTQQEDNVSSME